MRAKATREKNKWWKEREKQRQPMRSWKFLQMNRAIMIIPEIDAYFALDKLPCLLCGKEFYMLGNHLLAIHKKPLDEYREMFGLPYSKPLIGAKLHEKLSEAAKARPNLKENYARNKDTMKKSNRHRNRVSDYWRKKITLKNIMYPATPENIAKATAASMRTMPFRKRCALCSRFAKKDHDLCNYHAKKGDTWLEKHYDE